MSERSQIVPAPEGEYFETSRFSGLSLLLAGGAVVGLLLCLIGAITSPLQFSFSWLFGFIYFFTLCCGCLFWTIVHHATDARMVGRSAPAAREYRATSLRSLYFCDPDFVAPPSSF